MVAVAQLAWSDPVWNGPRVLHDKGSRRERTFPFCYLAHRDYCIYEQLNNPSQFLYQRRWREPLRIFENVLST
jgi:hypothetical protein